MNRIRFSFGRSLKFLLLVAGACVVAQPWAMAATGAVEGSETSVFLQADRIHYDEGANVVSATGNVEIARGERVLKADRVIYDRTSQTMRAEGHVVLVQESGDVVFADRSELTGDLKEGFAEKVGLLFVDNSRLAAAEAQRFEGRYLVVRKGVYSACDLCKENPDKAPLWQIRAGRVTHDAVKKDVMYRDAFVELYGIPVFYSPYISHPDPTVTRRQGFLSPSGGYNQNLGTFVRVPYYFDIAPHDDLVVDPTFSTTDMAQVAANWRHRFHAGRMDWRGSLTYADFVNEYGVDKGKEWRGHLLGNVRFDVDDIWRMGSEVALTTDKSYLQRYKISSDDVLLNRAFVEGFRGRDYARANAYYFQDLRPGSRLTEPVVAPDFKFGALGEPGSLFGGRWALNGGLLMTARKASDTVAEQGPDTRRLSLDAGWMRQFVSSYGLVSSLSGVARMDGYWANHVQDPGVSGSFVDVTKVRPFAQGDLTLRYPLGRRGDGYQHLIEPLTVLSVAPRQKSDAKLPNEDSLDVEFDETNLFSSSRFTGIDRLEGGTRVAYGVRSAVVGDDGARVEVLGGRVYRLNRDELFPEDSGLRERRSDYVGRIDFAPASWFDANYGFRVNPQTPSIERQEFKASGGNKFFRPSINYMYARQIGTSSSVQPTTFEEGSIGLSSNFTRNWTLSGSYKHAFRPSPGPRASMVQIAYKDECFQYGFTFQRDHTNRLDVESGSSFMFHFYLKNIGGLHTDSVSNGVFLPSVQDEDK